MATVAEHPMKTVNGVRVVEVLVLRRWRGSAVNPEEKCGIPEPLARELAALEPPAVKILRTDVPDTEGLGADPWQGGGQNALFEVMTELVLELRAKRAGK